MFVNVEDLFVLKIGVTPDTNSVGTQSILLPVSKWTPKVWGGEPIPMFM